MLDGSFTAATFQIGANSGDSITVGSLTDTRATALSKIGFSENTTAVVNPADATVTAFATPIAAGALTITVNGVATDLGPIAAAT